jgi:hypothetical protein
MKLSANAKLKAEVLCGTSKKSSTDALISMNGQIKAVNNVKMVSLFSPYNKENGTICSVVYHL